MNNFIRRLRIIQKGLKPKFVCVGLDIDQFKLPNFYDGKAMTNPQKVEHFAETIIEATHHVAAAFKINVAFFEAMGEPGLRIMHHLVEYIQSQTNCSVIGDAKRGDIGNTSEQYAKALFEDIGFDAVTLNPYMGLEDSLDKFIVKYPERGCIILCRTSNKGGAQIQDKPVMVSPNHTLPLWFMVARDIMEWNKLHGNCMMVMGAQSVDEIKMLRGETDTFVLIPGVGAQGQSAKNVVPAAMNRDGSGFLINSSRGIIYASMGDDFAEAAKREAEKLHEEIITARVDALAMLA